MASLDRYLASRQCLWDKSSSSGNQFVSVSEIIQSRCSETDHQTLHQMVENHELPAWLDETSDFPSVDADTKRRRRVLRVVWIPHQENRSGVNDVGEGVLELVTQRFSHQLPQARFRATLHGAGSVVEPSTWRRSFYFCKHPHLAITWSQDPTSGLTSVICMAQKERIDMFRDLMSCAFIQALASLAHVPALMCSILCYREIDGLMNNIKQQIRRTEARTGHHLFADRVETPATGELLLLSAEMSGCLSHVAVVTRKLGIMRELENFTFQEFERLRKEAKLEEEKAIIDEFVTNIKSIQQSSVLQKLDAECLTHRAQVQQDAVGTKSYYHAMFNLNSSCPGQASHCVNRCIGYSGACQGHTLRRHPHKEGLGKHEGSSPYCHIFCTPIICVLTLKCALV